MIELKGITKTFKKDFYKSKFVALDDVSFGINEGDLVGFLGANGAGKTTTLKIILNFIRADKGSVGFSPSLGSNHQGFLRNLGYLPERPYFHANLTGREFVRYMAQLHDVSKQRIETQIKKWGERLKIDHALDRKLQNYSKGMLQRIGFVASLVHDPKMLILDEPVSGLDPIGRKEIKDVMRELNQEGKTIFFSSHIVSDVEEICRNLVVLDAGKLIYTGSVSNILERESNGLSEMIIISDKKPNNQLIQEIIELGDNRLQLIFPRQEKSSLLKEMVNANIEVIKIRDENPSLEQIIYGKAKNL